MIELTSAILLLASSFAAPTAAEARKVAVVAPAVPTVIEEVTQDHPMTLGEYVREKFKDTPLLADIAFCESTMRHQNQDGTVIRGKVNSDDVGVLQINEYYHLEASKKLGYDIHTLEGNLAYGKWLYEKQGPQPWISSSPCWKKSAHYSPELLAKR